MTRPLSHPAPVSPRRGGFTLIELMVTLVIAAILLAIAVPSMREFVARKRVEGVAQELVTDLRYLRSMQIQRNVSVGIRFGETATASCYTLHTLGFNLLSDCNCTQQPVCSEDAVELKTVVLPRSAGVTVTSDPARLVLSGRNGLPLNGVTIQAAVTSSLGGQVRVSTNATARPVLCSVSGHESTLPACAPP